MAAEQSFLLLSPARRGQVGDGLPGRPGGGLAVPLAARNADRARGCIRHPAHRRRAQRVLPAAPAAPNRRHRSACSWTNCRPARTTCRKPSLALLLGGAWARHALPPGPGSSQPQPDAGPRAGARSMSSALVNRVTILHVRVDVDEWRAWAQRHGCAPTSARSSTTFPTRSPATCRRSRYSTPARVGRAVARARHGRGVRAC